MAVEILKVFHQWLDPFLQAQTDSLPEEIRTAFVNLDLFLKQIEEYLLISTAALGGAVTFLLWLFVYIQGRGLAKRVERASVPAQPQGTKKVAVKVEKAPVAAPAVEIKVPELSPQPAVQMLSILQRDGRLIDFLQEDLSAYEDAQIGAAVRSIHQGCKDALSEHLELKPIMDEPEGEEVTIPPNFDSRAIRLTGNVAGNPPFKGAIRHRGWRVVRLELPQPTAEQKKDWILAPAEVEV